MIKNNKGFAVSGILYAILILFLMLLLMILANFQSRKILFDKQKASVYEKLNDLELIAEYFYSENLQEFITPKDGIYLLEVWGADSSSSTGSYVRGKVELYQGIKLFIMVGNGANGAPSSIRTEKVNYNTVILQASGASTGSNYGYYETTSNEDIAIEQLLFYKIFSIEDIPNKKEDTLDGYVKISYVSELESN